MKYRPEFPERFNSLAEARTFCQVFFAWYNNEHRHSGIGYWVFRSIVTSDSGIVTSHSGAT